MAELPTIDDQPFTLNIIECTDMCKFDNFDFLNYVVIVEVWSFDIIVE